MTISVFIDWNVFVFLLFCPSYDLPRSLVLARPSTQGTVRNGPCESESRRVRRNRERTFPPLNRSGWMQAIRARRVRFRFGSVWVLPMPVCGTQLYVDRLPGRAIVSPPPSRNRNPVPVRAAPQRVFE